MNVLWVVKMLVSFVLGAGAPVVSCPFYTSIFYRENQVSGHYCMKNVDKGML